jgi:hypothetical protein
MPEAGLEKLSFAGRFCGPASLFREPKSAAKEIRTAIVVNALMRKAVTVG